MEEPLIYTSRGNVPLSGLAYTTAAQIVNRNVVLREEWRASDGEVVKSNCHVIPLEPLSATPEQAQIG